MQKKEKEVLISQLIKIVSLTWNSDNFPVFDVVYKKRKEINSGPIYNFTHIYTHLIASYS